MWIQYVLSIQILLISVYITSLESRRIKRVIGGVKVNCGSQVRVASLRNATTSRHLCGAVLISPKVALTAAHCVEKQLQYVLQLSNVCTATHDTLPQVNVLEIIKHPLYNRYTRAHDIAFLRIRLEAHDITLFNYDTSILPKGSFGLSDDGETYDFEKYKAYTCFRIIEKSDNVLDIGTWTWRSRLGDEAAEVFSEMLLIIVDRNYGECSVYGYGYTDIKTDTLSNRLKVAKLKIISLDECTNILGFYVAPRYDSGMLCALGDGVDTCQGDSGGPILCEGKLHGISSYGLSCGVPGVPGVYTSIGSHLPWIQEIAKYLSLAKL